MSPAMSLASSEDSATSADSSPGVRRWSLPSNTQRTARQRPLCRHCKIKPPGEKRGLCRSCYDKPGVKERYSGKYRSEPDGKKGGRALPEPTTAPPGTIEKIAVLIERVRLGQALWHHLDTAMDRVALPAEEDSDNE